MIDQACASLERLGTLNFLDSRVSDVIINEFSNEGTEFFILGGDNAVSGILPDLRAITFHIAGERSQEKILPAVVLGTAMRQRRGISSMLMPWRQEKASQALIVEYIRYVMKIQELIAL